MEPLPTTAVHHPPGETLEVFAADDDGAVKVAWKRRNELWQPPHGLTRDGFVPSGSPVAAAYHPPGRTLEAFVVALRHAGADARRGAVHVIWKVENERWSPGACRVPSVGRGELGDAAVREIARKAATEERGCTDADVREWAEKYIFSQRHGDAPDLTPLRERIEALERGNGRGPLLCIMLLLPA